MKKIKMFYEFKNLTHECLVECPFGFEYKAGSVACITKCKQCFGSGRDNMWLMSEDKGVYFSKPYIYCNKCYNKPYKLLRLLHRIKILINEILNK